MKQEKINSASEALVNTVLGAALNQAILYIAGIPLGMATGLTAVMFVVSYFRAYFVRRIFNLKEVE